MNERKIRTVVALLVLVSLATGGFWPAAARGPETPPSEFKAGEVLVRFKDGVPADMAAAALDRLHATRIRTLYHSDVELWQVPAGSEPAAVRQLNADSLVEYAEPNYVYRAVGAPNDPHFNKQWAHARIQSEAAWNISTGSTSITIAIIDTGIDEGHPDLASKIVAGYDFWANDSSPHDENGHGTHCAGIAAAVTNNGVGVAGMDWNARIMPIRVLNNEGSGYNSDITEGITWAYQHGARVLSLSLGGPSYSQSMQNAVNSAHAAGSLVVAAMGNERDEGNPTSYPAAYNHVMAVAATAPDDTYSYFSQYGSHCDIAAPGGEMGYLHDPDGIYSTMPTYSVYMNTEGFSQNYDYVHGTSQATPHVAGLAALVWSAAPTLTPDQVQNTIQSTAVDLGASGWDPDYGHGRINALAALQSVATPSAPTLSSISNPDGDGDYLVDWSDVPNAASYTLQEDDNAGFASPAAIYNGANSQVQVTGRGPGAWYYRVQASNGAGNSPWSSTQSVTVEPNAPTLNAINNAGNEDAYQVSWSTATGAASYTLQEDDDASFSSPTVRYAGAATQYTVTGQPGGTWYYRVRASNSGGDGPWSNVRSTTVAPAALPAPTLQAIVNPTQGGDYLVDWAEVPTATSYTLEESRDPYFSAPTVAYSGATSQFPAADQPGGTWYYRVRAFGPTGKSPWSSAQSTTVRSWIHLPLVLKDYASGGSGWTTIVSEDFEGAFPGSWDVSDDDPSSGSYYWGKRDCRPYAGGYSGWAVGGGDGAGMPCGSNYPLDVEGWMVYGPFSLADASAAELTFRLWLNIEEGYDEFFWGASIDGTNFYGSTTTGNSGGWIQRKLDLTNVPPLGNLTGRSQVWIALVFVSDYSVTYPEGAYVNDIVLRKYVGVGASAVSGTPVVPATLRETSATFSLRR